MATEDIAKGMDFRRLGRNVVRLGAAAATLGGSEVILGAAHYAPDVMEAMGLTSREIDWPEMPGIGGESWVDSIRDRLFPEASGGGGEGGGEGFDIDAMIAALFGSAQQITDMNFANAPEFYDMVLQQSLGAAGAIDERTQQARTELGLSPEELLGGMATARGIAQEYMTGQLPQDVQDQIIRARAEQFAGTGMMGPGTIGGAATARDLGLNSLQLQQYGMQMYPQLAAQSLALGQQYIPGTMALPQFYSQGLGTMAPYFFTQPGSMIGAISSGYQTGAQVGLGYAQLAEGARQFDENMDFSNYWSQQQMQWSQYQMQMQLEAQRRAEQAARRSQWMQLGGMVAGIGLNALLPGSGAALSLFGAASNGGFGNGSYSGWGDYGRGTYSWGFGEAPSGYFRAS